MIGWVATVSASQMTVRLGKDRSNGIPARVGAMIKAAAGDRHVIGRIASVQTDAPVQSPEEPVAYVLVVDLVGELIPQQNGAPRFTRGVSFHPVPGAAVDATTTEDMALIFAPKSDANVRLATLYDNEQQPVYVNVDDLLAKHFAVLGSSGSGKSSTVALILTAILDQHPGAHILLLDPHNEYSTAFPDKAEVLNVDNVRLPFWLLNFEEAIRVLVRGGTGPDRESQITILRDAIARARRQFAGNSAATPITVDTPTPFRISDLLRIINEGMGKLDKPDSSLPYMRLKNRLDSLRGDKRFAFMFHEGLDVSDSLSELVGRLLRIPVNGKPLAIFDLSGVPSEITDVVVSLSCRLMFDYAVWSDRENMPPILLVCEEAHRYVPAGDAGFAATSRAITRIAKEGRKYGLALALITQRPSELSPEALSQCGTVFSMRLANERDQDFVSRTVPDVARGMLNALPSLPTQQAIVSGEGVPIPMRVRIDNLPPGHRPHSSGAKFSSVWRADFTSEELRDETVRRWRAQERKT